jgi:CHRD domain
MKQPGVIIVLLVFVAAVSFTLASEQYRGRKLKAALSGAAEVPGPGDTDGTGTFAATLNAGKNQVCYELRVSNIATATAAHIHSGESTKAGPVLLNLAAPANGSSKECVTLDREKILEIIKTPENYYVNVHNAEFPDGAVRGQLSK